MPKDPLAVTTTILTFIMLVSNFILMITMWVDKAKAPVENQDARISRLEDRVDELESLHAKDKDKIKELEKGNVVMQEAQLALLSHAIDGNNTDGLIRARDNLQTYLTHKGVSVQ